MQEDKAVYHEAAIRYNDELAEKADALADTLEHPEVARWSRAVAKQHRFHAGRHRKALDKVHERAEQSQDPPLSTPPSPLGFDGRSGDLTPDEVARLDAASEEEDVDQLSVGPDTEDRAEADVETEEERNARIFAEAQARAEASAVSA